MGSFEESKIIRNASHLELYGNMPTFKHVCSLIGVWNGLVDGEVYSDSEDSELEYEGYDGNKTDEEKARLERLANWIGYIKTLHYSFNGEYRYSDDEITALESDLIESAVKEMEDILEDLGYYN